MLSVKTMKDKSDDNRANSLYTRKKNSDALWKVTEKFPFLFLTFVLTALFFFSQWALMVSPAVECTTLHFYDAFM